MKELEELYSKIRKNTIRLSLKKREILNISEKEEKRLERILAEGGVKSLAIEIQKKYPSPSESNSCREQTTETTELALADILENYTNFCKLPLLSQKIILRCFVKK